MQRNYRYSGWSPRSAVSWQLRLRAGQSENRSDHHTVRSAGGARPAAAQRISARAQDARRQAGRRDVELLIQDDELKPDVAVTKVKALVERDKVDFVVGPIFSNILQAILKPATEGGAFLISPNAGTSNFAGKECNPNLFVVSYQNDQNHEVLGKYAQDSGIKKAFIMAPNYQAGKDSLAGFKRYFKGEVVG